MLAALALALASSPLLVRAAILPSGPAPDTIFREGSKCTISWNADPEPNSPWKTTNIQFMTGDNFQMVHLTTVATVDGTQAGSHEWDCPDVTINSMIYFYQFSSPGSSELFWTGRWGIATADGQLTEPTETNTPTTTDGVKWGTGALADPSTARPAPEQGAPPTGTPDDTNPTGGDNGATDPAETGTPPDSSDPTTPSGPSRLPSATDEEEEKDVKKPNTAADNQEPADSEPTGAAFKGAIIDATFSVLAVSAAAFMLIL